MIYRYRLLLVGLSIVIAALAMWLWMRNFDVSGAEFATLFRHIKWWPILPLLLLIVSHIALSSWRWSLIEGALSGVRPRFGPAFVTGAFAQGLGTFLPSPLINVACRGLANRLSGASGLRGALSGSIDQIADFATILLMAIPAVIAFVHRDFLVYIWGVMAMVPLGLLLTLSLPVIIRSLPLRASWRGQNWTQLLVDRSTLLKLYGISLVRLTNLTLMNVVVHFAIGTATIPAILVSVPLVALATSAAMLPGAFGISEWSFSAVFAGFAIDPNNVVMFVLANRILLTGASLAIAASVLCAKAPAWWRLTRRKAPLV